MHFQINETQGPRLVKRIVQGVTKMEPVAGPKLTRYAWTLESATGPLARSPESYGSPIEARGAIARFKRSAGGIKFAKVQDA